MHIYVIFNPNQEKNLLGYKVVDYSNYLNGVFGFFAFQNNTEVDQA